MRVQHISEDDFTVMENRVQGGVDARHATRTGSSGEAASQQTKSRRGESAPAPLILSLTGPMVSGKNQVQLLWRHGTVHKYPNATFSAWRLKAALQLVTQGKPTKPMDHPVSLVCDYWPADRRTRDVTGMLDALFHLLVWTGILKDDGLIYNVTWRRHALNRPFPKVVMEIQEYV